MFGKARATYKTYFGGNTTGRHIFFKNTLWLALSEFITKPVQMIATFILVRAFLPEDFGLLNYAYSIIPLFLIFADLGLNPAIIVNTARNPRKTQNYLITGLILRTLIGLAILLPIKMFMQSNLFVLVGLTLLIQSLSEIFNSIFQGREEMHKVLLVRAIYNFATLLAAIYAFTNHVDIVILMQIYLIGALSSLFVAVRMSRKYLKFKSVILETKLVKQAMPLFGTAICLSIYGHFDSVIIGQMSGNSAVGFYQAAYKVMFIMLSLTLLNNAIMPRLTVLVHKKRIARFWQIVKLYSVATLAFLIPLAIGVSLLSKEIVTMLFGHAYLTAATTFAIFAWVGLASFFRSFAGSLLIVLEKQKYYFQIILLGTIVNGLLNLLLVPQIGFASAAGVLLISEVLITVLAFVKVANLRAPTA